jgi:hypothetical protein
MKKLIFSLAIIFKILEVTLVLTILSLPYLLGMILDHYLHIGSPYYPLGLLLLVLMFLIFIVFKMTKDLFPIWWDNNVYTSERVINWFQKKFGGK